MPHLSVHVGDAAVALGGAVKLADLRDLEALREGLPHAGPQTVPHRQPDFVALFRRTHRLGEEVAANLPDVLHNLERSVSGLIIAAVHAQSLVCCVCAALARWSSYSAVVLDAIFPEAAGGELFLDDDGESVDQTLTDSHDVTWSGRGGGHLSDGSFVLKNVKLLWSGASTGTHLQSGRAAGSRR